MTIEVISLCIGGALLLLAWLVAKAFLVVPAENRQFMDRPPLGFRMIWPLIKVWAFHFDWLYSDSLQNKVARKLKKGGVEYSLSALQFLSAKAITALLCFGLVVVLTIQTDPMLLWLGAGLAAISYFYPDLWLKESTEKRRGEILRTLPFYLDIVTLSVEAGTNLTGGMTQAVQKTNDSVLRREFSRVLRDVRAGKTRSESLREMAERSGSPVVSNVVTSLVQAERTGSSLGPILRAQSDQLRSMRFQRAEKKALEAPVKLLVPLVGFIFPTTFLVLIFMILSKAILKGILTWPLLVWAWQWPGGLQ